MRSVTIFLGVGVAVLLACGSSNGQATTGETTAVATTMSGGTTDGAMTTSGVVTTGSSASGSESTGAASSTGAMASAGETSTSTTGASGTTGTMTSTDDSTSTGTSVDDSTGSSAGSSTGTGSSTGDKLDMGGPMCEPDNICCLEEGELPPHKLLDAFLLTYPPQMMPKSVAAVQAFTPVADGHKMAWSKLNVGNELVDVANGGVIEANIVAGRDLAQAAAEMAMPPDAKTLDVREDPVVIEDLGGKPPCIGVGWGWGSVLFENVDKSIGEVVYLYVGYCATGDVEVFFFSDQSVEICAAPG